MSANPNTATHRSQSEIAAAILKFAREKQAATAPSSSVDTTDPTNQGTKAIPKDNSARQCDGVSASGQDDSVGGKTPSAPSSPTNPAGTGEGKTPSTQNGNAKEKAFTDVSTPVEKIATRANKIAERLASLSKGASTTPTKDETPGASKPDTTKQAGEDSAPKKTGDSATAKQAGDDASPDELTWNLHVKLAAAILETEEGQKMAHNFLAKQAGEKAATDLVRGALAQHIEFQKIASAEEAEAQELQNQVDEFYKKASTEERQLMVKSAQLHKINLDEIDDPMLKWAYQDAAMDAGAMLEDEGGMIPGEAEEPSVEDIEMVLADMVQTGEIDPETAEAVLEILVGGEDGLAGGEDPLAGGEDPLAGAGGEEALLEEAMAADPEMAGMMLDPKQASATIDALRNMVLPSEQK